MKNFLDYNVRSGRHLNMTEVLDDLETAYIANLHASIDAFSSYDEVQAETFNDEGVIKAILSTYNKCGYIEDEELTSMLEEAKRIRLNVLEEMEKENENGKN